MKQRSSMMMINKKIIKCHVTRGIRTKTRVASTNRRYQYHLRTQRSQMIPLLAKSTSIEQIQRHNYCMGTVSTESAYGNNKYLPAMISTSSWPASEDEEADFTFVIDNKCKFALEVQDEMSLDSDNSNNSIIIIIIILRNLLATYSSKTKDLFNCHVLHHSKTAGAIGMYFPSSQRGRKQGN